MSIQKKISDNSIVVLSYPKSVWEARRVAGIFLECTGYELPFPFDEWRQSVKAPVELYFVFERKRPLMNFLKMVRNEMPDLKIIM